MAAIRDIIDSRRLLMFYHVAQAGSVSKAEAALSTAQPAISRHISRLEEELDVQLLDRNGRGVTLTRFGELLYQRAETILQEMADAVEALDVAKRSPAGRVSICGSAIVMSLFMPEIVNRMIGRFPEIEIVAVQAASGEVYSTLVSGRCDVAIVMRAPNKQKFNHEKVLTEPMIIVAAKDHPVAKKRVVRRQDLPDLPLILPAAPYGMRAIIDDYARAGDVKLAQHLQVDSVPLIRQTVLKGSFCAIMPLSSFQEEFGEDKFAAIPLQPSLTRTLYVASVKSEIQSPYVAAMIETVIAVFREWTAELDQNRRVA